MRFPLYFFFLSSAVIASHSAPAGSHARRALRLRDIRDVVGGVVNAVVGGGSSLSPSSTPNAGSAVPSDSSATSSSDPSSITPAPSGTTPDVAGGLLSSVVSGAGSVVSDAASAVSSVVSGVTSAASDVNSAASSAASPVTSLLPATSVDTSLTNPTSDTGSLSASSPSDTATSSAPTSDAPTSVPPTSTSASPSGDILSSILGVTSILSPPTTTSSAPPDTILSSALQETTSAPPPTSATDGNVLSSIVSQVSSAMSQITSVPPPPPTSTTTDGNVLSSIASQVSSAASQVTSVPPPVSTDLPASIPTSVPPITSDVPPITSDVPPITSNIPSITSNVPLITSEVPLSIASSVPPLTDEPSTAPSGLPSSVVSGLPSVASSAQPSIVFPTSVVSSTASNSAASISVDSDSTTPVASTSTAISVAPEFSFILSESSLALTSIATPTSQPTLTDPDQATTTVDPTVATAATTLTVAPLPTGIPARIYPQDQLNSGTDLQGYTLISILFNQELNWPFVVNNQVSSSQIFAYIPVIISTALGIPADQVKTWALQVYVPSTYETPADQSVLGTMWLGYIPSDLVDTLAAEIKAKQSAFYTGVPDAVAQALAEHVNTGFSITSVADPNLSPGSSSSSPGPGVVGSTSSEGKARQDAIIGVVSALGAIAVLVLVFLVYRSMKRRKQLAHRRLSDPPDVVVGTRPEGREFDQDSVGGARRRSFYYAEDSLRGYAGEGNQDVGPPPTGAANPQITQRRNVIPAAISAPILRESSMNW